MNDYGSRFTRTEPVFAQEGSEVCCPCCGVSAETYYRDEAGQIAGCESCLRTTYWYELIGEEEEFF